MNFFNLWQSFCLLNSIKLIIYISGTKESLLAGEGIFWSTLKNQKNETGY
jgi:hypothetical protein